MNQSWVYSTIQIFFKLIFTIASLLANHIKGKKHQSLQKVQEAQSKAGALSVYVTGVKCSETNEDEMSTFFSSFGKVKKIFFDKNKVRYIPHN